jgi:bifunctional non-homologous end joining protein LigD
MAEIIIDSKSINITHPEKILFPKNKITKLDVINYYKNIANHILPYIQNRPLTLNCFPQGISNPGFVQQHAGHVPEWFKTFVLDKVTGGKLEHILCNDQASLIYLANQNMITAHRWLSRIDDINHPDLMIVDLDPPTTKFNLVAKGAMFLKKALDNEGLSSFPLLTGSKGLHIIIQSPANTRFDQVKIILTKLIQPLIKEYPQEFTTEIKKEKRQNAVYVDLLRNAYGQTAVAPYSLRPTEEASIAVPISWNELDDPALTSKKYNIKNIFERLATL